MVQATWDDSDEWSINSPNEAIINAFHFCLLWYEIANIGLLLDVMEMFLIKIILPIYVFILCILYLHEG